MTCRASQSQGIRASGPLDQTAACRQVATFDDGLQLQPHGAPHLGAEAEETPGQRRLATRHLSMYKGMPGESDVVRDAQASEKDSTTVTAQEQGGSDNLSQTPTARDVHNRRSWRKPGVCWDSNVGEEPQNEGDCIGQSCILRSGQAGL